MTDNTIAERQRRLLRRDQAAGIARVVVRVPVEQSAKIRLIARLLMQEKTRRSAQRQGKTS